jgi:ribosomal protein S18 acetylase RimI-like enzyme
VTDQELADAASAALIEALTDVTALNSHARVVLGDGARLLITGGSAPGLNPLLTSDPRPDPAEIDRLATLADDALPWSITLRREPTAEVLEVATKYGRDHHGSLALMACRRDDARLRGPARGAPAIRVMTSAERISYGAMVGAGFEAPPEAVLSYISDQVIDADWMKIYVAELDGVPIAVGSGARTGDHIGVFNIAVIPAFRGRGYGRLLTERVMTDGFDAGASVAYLQPSDLSLGLYETIGFRTVETWTYLS